jgi:hypothetical protein
VARVDIPGCGVIFICEAARIPPPPLPLGTCLNLPLLLNAFHNPNALLVVVAWGSYCTDSHDILNYIYLARVGVKLPSVLAQRFNPISCWYATLHL